jgi:hypothetical protein
MSVTRRGAGCGGFVCGRRPHARHGFKPRPAVRAAGGPVEECPPGTLEQTCSAPRAERRNLSAVRSVYLLMRFHSSRMRLRALQKARRSARPSLGMECDFGYGVPRAANNRGGEAMPRCLILSRPPHPGLRFAQPECKLQRGPIAAALEYGPPLSRGRPKE